MLLKGTPVQFTLVSDITVLSNSPSTGVRQAFTERLLFTGRTGRCHICIEIWSEMSCLS